MAYIGNTAEQQAFTPAIDFFSGNGVTTAFTLSRPVASVAQVQATIENVPQNPGTAFTVSGNTITFDGAPPSGTNNIYVYYTSPITQVIQPGQGTVGTAQIQNGAVIPADLSTGAPVWDTSGNVGIGTSVTSGNKFTVAGSAGSVYIEPTGDVIAFSRNTANYISAKGGASASLVFETGGTTERMRINSSGQVTIPSQPTFTVRKNNGTSSTAAGIIVFNAVSTNTGSHYNSTNGRFTAPIAGRYLFVFTGAGQTTADFVLLINGATTNYQGYSFGSNVTSSANAIFNLNANDYVQVESFSSYRGDAHTMWCGCLVN